MSNPYQQVLHLYPNQIHPFHDGVRLEGLLLSNKLHTRKVRVSVREGIDFVLYTHLLERRSTDTQKNMLLAGCASRTPYLRRSISTSSVLARSQKKRKGPKVSSCPNVLD